MGSAHGLVLFQRPMSRSEKRPLWVGFFILSGYPFPFMVLGGADAWAGVALGGLVLFIIALLRMKCSSCVNFSCPLNRVPENVVNDYLERNRVMKKAGRRSGI